jgi:enamine deaminase RidA (YjgF/YER057c/UK114 family)
MKPMKNKHNCLFYILIFMFTHIIQAQEYKPEQRLEELGITLPEVSVPVANYLKWRQVGNMLYVAGHGSQLKGTLGEDLSVEEGYEAARQTGVAILATIKKATGDLSRVKAFIQVRGMVNSADDFYQQPQVINGFSDLMVEVFGKKGKHARAAVGHNALPNNIAVEIETVVLLED